MIHELVEALRTLFRQEGMCPGSTRFEIVERKASDGPPFDDGRGAWEPFGYAIAGEDQSGWVCWRRSQ